MARKVLDFINELLNMVLLSVVLLLFLYGCYGLWDSHKIYEAADRTQYEIYKPTEHKLSFEELQSKNPDVLGWLTIYGTGVDYPLVQGTDNDVYLNTSVTGEYSLSGSIFLDSRNQRDFSDFNSLVYGHHMEKSTMFGDIGRFVDAAYFEEHRYGSLYYEGREHGIEFFAALSVDAYDTGVYRPAVTGAEAQQEYLDGIWAKAVQKRPLEVTTEDHLILLSTCDSRTTSGRHILVGRISDEVTENPFKKETKSNYKDTGESGQQTQVKPELPFPKWRIGAVVLVLVLLLAVFLRKRKQRQRKMGDKDEKKKHNSI